MTKIIFFFFNMVANTENNDRGTVPFNSINNFLELIKEKDSVYLQS